MSLYNPGGDAKPIFKIDSKQGICKLDNVPVPLKNFKAILDIDALERRVTVAFGKNTQRRFPYGAGSPTSRQARQGRRSAPKCFDQHGKPEFKWGFRCT